MKKLLVGLLALGSISSFANETITRSIDIHQLLLKSSEIQSIPLAAQLAFGQQVQVSEIELIGKDYETGCYKRVKVSYTGESDLDSSTEKNLDSCIKY